ncbi:hypothetical protein PHLGIDRAFT_112861 [Phlebiopsis gigantea 11061_1 CR5-6]|uniref:Septation initiation network scaffold protein cdc11 n=1 Tax=Phlebiopsis gigantea (strain 11061_1 CR5-6) TaxID=745531 RepID=A0A0C3RPW6_PHLG1|nr:hypothetical protein PHLGIDRAFT_112861 [Phlebiopsis gigantea 11061_1 CR5-6]
MFARPTWMTEELDEEWVDEQDEQDDHDPPTTGSQRDVHTVSDISFTQPIGSLIIIDDGGDRSHRTLSSDGAGTVVFHESQSEIDAPFLPQTPARGKKILAKDLFSPLPLEKMFEPPSPPSLPPQPTSGPSRTSAPAIPSRLSQVYIPGENDTTTDIEISYGDLTMEKDTMEGKEDRGDIDEQAKYQFTFAAPVSGAPTHPTGSRANAQSTPLPSQTPLREPVAFLHPPLTDPRLRLFQFQYDTFTREHLSAMVDSIAVNTPSGGSRAGGSKDTTPTGSSSQVSDHSMSRLRSAKRLKLSPASDFSEEGDGAAVIIRPHGRRDYVGESQSLMEKIRQARDFSTISSQGIPHTPASGQEDDSLDSVGRKDQEISFLAVPNSRIPSEAYSAWTTNPGQRPGYSSLAIREQATSLMNQIRSDVKSHKRLYSVDSNGSMVQNDARSLQSHPQFDDAAQGDPLFEGHSEIIHGGDIEPEPVGRPRSASSPPVASGNRASATSELHADSGLPSNTASGGTVTSGSAASFVKHQGPKHITHISPDDLPPLPDRVGPMMFDRNIMKWVKASSMELNGEAASGTMRTDGSGESDDPFRDIESIRDDDTAPAHAALHAEGHVEDMSLDDSRADAGAADSGPEDEEEAELTSFSFDASARAAELQDGQGSEEDEDTITSGQFTSIGLLDGSFAAAGDAPHTSATQEPALQDTPPHLLAPHASTPQPSAPGPAPTPIIRSVLKSTSVTPVSVMKDTNRGRTQTPANKLTHRRSVSFSDGKRDGPIVGLGRNAPTPDGSVDTDPGSLSDSCAPGTSDALMPSVRSKRIADMLEGLEDTSYDGDASPSKASSGRGTADELQPLGAKRAGSSTRGREMSRRTFSQSLSARSPATKPSGRNATFLTECSFGVAHDRLVQVITDVQPFEPYWEALSAIDLANKNLDSVARLKEFLPRLDSLCLNSNQIGWLSGIPSTVRTLSIASNCLTAVTSFSHLLNLESLDISRNNIDSLRQLECLRHLRELRADGNMVNSLDGLQKMDGLVKLSLQGNALQGTVDLAPHNWARLEMLNLSHNRLSTVVGLSSLPALIALNLDNNQLAELGTDGVMPRLRILRVSGNRLQELNAAPFPSLRTLYADSNSLGPVFKAHRLTRLENLSLRNQSGRTGL